MLNRIGKLEAIVIMALTGVYLVFLGFSGILFHISETYYMPVFKEWFIVILIGIALILPFVKYEYSQPY